jgi:hypothetical protein
VQFIKKQHSFHEAFLRTCYTIGEIVISPRAHKNVNGIPYASLLNFTHSSDLRTMQEIFRIEGPFLGMTPSSNKSRRSMAFAASPRTLND